MKELLSILQDNSGGVSMMRVLVAIVIVTVCLPKIVTAIQGSPISWSAEEIGIVVSALGAKAVQRGKEAPEKAATPPAPTLPVPQLND